MKKIFKLAFPLIVVLSSAIAGLQSASAGVIVGATAIITNTMGTAGGSTANIINQSGLSVGYTSGVTDFDLYMATHPTNNAGNAWAGSGGVTSGDMIFDLGSSYNLESFALWTQNNTSAINAFDLLVDGSFVGSFNASIGVSSNIAVQTFSFAQTTGQFVTLRVNSTHGGPNVNIGEVAFEASVPEPTSLALLSLGVVGLGLSRRRKAA